LFLLRKSREREKWALLQRKKEGRRSIMTPSVVVADLGVPREASV
jgi:hypothetical protein